MGISILTDVNLKLNISMQPLAKAAFPVVSTEIVLRNVSLKPLAV